MQLLANHPSTHIPLKFMATEVFSLPVKRFLFASISFAKSLGLWSRKCALLIANVFVDEQTMIASHSTIANF